MTAPPQHLRLPLTLAADGSLATVDQDSPEDVTQSVNMLLGTRPGTRLTIPDYGLPDPTFADLTAADFTALASEWEPRAQLTVTITGDGRTRTYSVGVAVQDSA